MGTPTSDRHHRRAAGLGPVPFAVVTVSDSRTPETDDNGRYLRERIEAAGHRLVHYRVIPDEPAVVARAVEEVAAAGEARILLFNGGTGIAPRDTTHDALARLLEKQLPGFGELFRMLSWEQVGAAAMMSRALAGVHRGLVVFSTPGSPAAVRLAWERLIEPEAEHLAGLVAGEI